MDCKDSYRLFAFKKSLNLQMPPRNIFVKFFGKTFSNLRISKVGEKDVSWTFDPKWVTISTKI